MCITKQCCWCLDLLLYLLLLPHLGIFCTSLFYLLIWCLEMLLIRSSPFSPCSYVRSTYMPFTLLEWEKTNIEIPGVKQRSVSQIDFLKYAAFFTWQKQGACLQFSLLCTARVIWHPQKVKFQWSLFSQSNLLTV